MSQFGKHGVTRLAFSVGQAGLLDPCEERREALHYLMRKATSSIEGVLRLEGNLRGHIEQTYTQQPCHT
jgi:hypothetical protein